MLKAVLTTAAIAAFLLLLYVLTQNQAQARCEVCLTYQGREACRTVAASTREEAQQVATANACAILTGGVTNILECERTPPNAITCGSE